MLKQAVPKTETTQKMENLEKVEKHGDSVTGRSVISQRITRSEAERGCSSPKNDLSFEDLTKEDAAPSLELHDKVRSMSDSVQVEPSTLIIVTEEVRKVHQEEIEIFRQQSKQIADQVSTLA